MTTLYLRFPDEATFRATLDPTFVDSGETGAPLPQGVEAIRMVGDLYEDATPPVLIPGFHVNVLGVLPPAWVRYEIHPVSPAGVFG